MEVFGSYKKHIHNDVVSTLPLYRSAPPLEVRLEDFELFAMDRLKGNPVLLSYSLLEVSARTFYNGLGFVRVVESFTFPLHFQTNLIFDLGFLFVLLVFQAQLGF